MYINWLNMARAGFVGLEFYRPETKTWGQAHMQARFCILQCLLEAGEEFVTSLFKRYRWFRILRVCSC